MIWMCYLPILVSNNGLISVAQFNGCARDTIAVRVDNSADNRESLDQERFADHDTSGVDDNLDLSRNDIKSGLTLLTTVVRNNGVFAARNVSKGERALSIRLDAAKCIASTTLNAC